MQKTSKTFRRVEIEVGLEKSKSDKVEFRIKRIIQYMSFIMSKETFDSENIKVIKIYTLIKIAVTFIKHK